jgi:NAD(P)H-dependent nitrite reductase small subunit
MMGAIAAVDVMLETGYWEDVCCVDDLIENIGVCALVGGRQIAIFRLGNQDSLFAIDNHDPFSEANVLSRGVVGDLKGQLVIASPIYKQHFNLKTGQCLEDETVKLDVFKVRVVDGVVQILNPNHS